MAEPTPETLARLAELARDFADAYENSNVPLDVVTERASVLRDEIVSAGLPVTAQRNAPRDCSVEALFGGAAMVGNWG